MRFRWQQQTRALQTFGNANQTWTTRSSTLLIVQDTDGEYGVGEASPLPGYSPDGLGDVEPWFQRLCTSHVQVHAAMSFMELLAMLDFALPPAPSALLAAQTACLDLWAKRRKASVESELWQVLNAPLPNDYMPVLQDVHLRVAPLLELHASNVRDTAMNLLARGYTTFKAKIGIDLKRELAVLRELATSANAHGSAIVFRLDANQSLSVNDLYSTLTALSSLPVEYVEEPCAVKDVPVDGTLPVRLGLDESLLQGRAALAPWLNPATVAAIVCKPMIVGDLRQVLSWATHASRLGCQFVLSHLFDGVVAFRLYEALARVTAPDGCHGLFAHAGLQLWSDRIEAAPGSGLGLRLSQTALQGLHLSGTGDTQV